MMKQPRENPNRDRRGVPVKLLWPLPLCNRDHCAVLWSCGLFVVGPADLVLARVFFHFEGQLGVSEIPGVASTRATWQALASLAWSTGGPERERVASTSGWLLAQPCRAMYQPAGNVFVLYGGPGWLLVRLSPGNIARSAPDQDSKPIAMSFCPGASVPSKWESAPE